MNRKLAGCLVILFVIVISCPAWCQTDLHSPLKETDAGVVNMLFKESSAARYEREYGKEYDFSTTKTEGSFIDQFKDSPDYIKLKSAKPVTTRTKTTTTTTVVVCNGSTWKAADHTYDVKVPSNGAIVTTLGGKSVATTTYIDVIR